MPPDELQSLHDKIDRLTETVTVVLQGDLKSDRPGLKQQVHDCREDIDDVKQTQVDIKTQVDEMWPTHKLRKKLWAGVGSGIAALGGIEAFPWLAKLFGQ